MEQCLLSNASLLELKRIKYNEKINVSPNADLYKNKQYKHRKIILEIRLGTCKGKLCNA